MFDNYEGETMGNDPLTDIGKAAAIEAVKQGYKDVLQPAATQIGKSLKTVFRLFNVGLAPVRAAAWSGEQLEEYVKNEIAPKLAYTPPENIVPPDTHIAVPAVIALTYTHEQDELREMYANLLANAMDSDTKDDIHPSFVEVIRQLTPTEAQLLSMLDGRHDWKTNTLCTSKVTKTPSMQGKGFFTGGSGGIATNHILEKFLKLCEESVSEIDAYIALDNFRRLRLMDVALNIHQNVVTRNNKLEMKTDYTELLFWTPYGQVFLRMCVRPKVANKEKEPGES
jgi:hypothetical protein